jgi:hypothetical protein
VKQEESDKALLAYLRGHTSADISEDQGALATPRPRHDDVDDLLRGMGYSPTQREQLRRRQPRPRDEIKHRAVTIKRFQHYIKQRLPMRTEEEIARLARAWVSLTNYDLDLAQCWWDAGVNPGQPGELSKAIEGGLRVQDLGEVVHGRSVASHLQAGNSPDWCLIALEWKRRPRSA